MAPQVTVRLLDIRLVPSTGAHPLTGQTLHQDAGRATLPAGAGEWFPRYSPRADAQVTAARQRRCSDSSPEVTNVTPLDVESASCGLGSVVVPTCERLTMPKSCAVCRRLDRASIDLRLARHQVNVAEIARELRLSDTTVRRHREQHVPAFLKVYGAAPELPTKGELHGELMRLYVTTLDSLAMAEAGTLEGLNEDGSERRKVSHGAIQGYVREARRLVGEIAALAADAGDEEQRPTGMARGELAQRIMARLDTPRVSSHADLVHDDAQECIAAPSELPTAIAQEAAHRAIGGGQAVEPGRPSPPEMSLDAVMPPKPSTPDLPGIADHPRLKQVIADHEATLRRADPAHEDSPAVMYAPNPRYPGSPAASQEERAADGYPDIAITLEDIKSLPDEVARLIAEHRANNPNPEPTT